MEQLMEWVEIDALERRLNEADDLNPSAGPDEIHTGESRG